ncbi:guanylate kinase [Ligilactobacillus ruminis ATCC 25644]|uniref:Guanylate kinase n=3 Tax=Ligilactobacillus ruminis TaxID=1623 RepID=E7FQT8_9LACO|nr:guanylate kinase [Ligilactobacillus ruminis ATCC 25644]
MKQVYYVSAFYANNMLIDIFGGKTMENKVIVLCGAPGSGKTTVRKYLTENFAIEPVLTHTTRPKRKGEHDGIDYWFETRETFFENHYLEYVEYDGNLYGSSYESLERAWQKAPVATIVLDTKGAETYLERIPEKTEVVYLCVTDEKVQRERMEQRGDDADKIRRRLASQEAKRDRKLPERLVKHVHVIENDDWEETKVKIQTLLQMLGIETTC